MNEAPSALANLCKDLVAQKATLERALFQYGDHTLECYRAPTDKCICGWTQTRRALNIKPRKEGE